VKRILLLVLILCSATAKGQGILKIKPENATKGKTLTSLLAEIEIHTAARFYFLPNWIEAITLQQTYDDETLESVLDDLFRGTDISFFPMYKNAVVFIKDPAQALRRKNAIETAVLEQKKISRYIFGEPGKIKKGRIVITGQVSDIKTKQPIPRTNIQVSGTQNGTVSDENGKFSLSLSPGLHVLIFSFVDYESKIVDMEAYEDGVIEIAMEEMATLLDEVVVQDHVMHELSTSRIGQIQLTIRDIKRAPALLGEPDLFKQIQTLPGVTTVGEAALGFNVRGGSVDQNLILYDGIPVFNSSHVFGFFSAFNPEAVRDISFYKGGIPAEYGGRISSVLDVQSKNGDSENWHGSAGIGMITCNMMINGPVIKKKLSVAASFRTTYSNWLINSIRTDYADLRKSSVFFYDGTLKLTHLVSDRTKISFTGYSSKDAFRLRGDTIYQWNNFQASVRLDHQFSSELSSDFVAGVSSYGYHLINNDELTASELSYKITSMVVKTAFNYQHGGHKLNFGGQLVHYTFNPGMLKPTTQVSNARNTSLDKQYSIETAVHIADEWSFNDRMLLEAGVRVPVFLNFGPASVNVYGSNTRREVTNIVDTIHFHGAEVVKTFVGVEPRLSFRWMTGPSASIKFGYNRMYQYLHLITNTTAVTPVDIWQPSGYYFKPQRADQVSSGYFRDFHDKKFGASAEIFYKTIAHITDFKDGAQLIMNRHLETDLLQGKAWSYGIETSFSKNTGRFTGSLNYTYSRAFRQVGSAAGNESINHGRRYPANFDQPHILNISWRYNFSKRHFLTGNFTYHTGRPVTIPLSAFLWENSTVAYFSSRNQYRIPDYHRLDLALVIEGNHKRTKKWKGSWVLSVYNVYGRKNPYSVFFRDSGTGIPKPYQLSIIGTVFPSLSYNIKF
jgi:hypothetical protein